jgi:putative hydrolase of the HAD superfamily
LSILKALSADCLYNNIMSFTTLFFDLDETLYTKGNGLWDAIAARMNEYIHVQLNLPPEEVSTLRRHYYESYGTTLRGLQLHHQVDANDYLAYVHDLPLEDYIHPDPQLHQLLSSLSLKKWIFTNADSHHASRVLDILGVSDCFEGIIDVRAIEFICKPEIEAYHRALTLANEDQPIDCILLDDSVRNLVPAKGLGFTTVLVSSNGTHPAADYTLDKIHQLPNVLPDLWHTH